MPYKLNRFLCVGILVIAILRRAIAANGAGFAALVLGIVGTCPPAIGIGVIGVVIGRRAAAGAGFRATVLGIRILAP